MRSKGDKFRREQGYISTATENARLAEDVAANFTTLSTLITDDMSADVFQTTYCRMSVNYTGGDVVEQFRTTFFATKVGYDMEAVEYNGMVLSYDDKLNGE